MAHAQKPDLVFQRNVRVHLYRRGCQFSRLLAAEVCASAVVMLDRPCPIQCTTAGYPLHSPFSPSLLHPCVSVCHHIPFLLYMSRTLWFTAMCCAENVLYRWKYSHVEPIPVAVRSKTSVCGRSLVGIAGSNLAGDMDVSLLWVLCVVK